MAVNISKIFGNEDSIVFDDSYSDGQYKKTADNSELLRLLPDFKFTKLKDGLHSVIKYFITNYDTLRVGQIDTKYKNLWKPEWDFE